MDREQIEREQQECLALKRSGVTSAEIGKRLGMSRHQVHRRIKSAEKAERLDDSLKKRLNDKGIIDFGGLHSGWLLEKDEQGSGSSLYFYLGPDEEKISFADAVLDALADIPRLPPIQRIDHETGEDQANWFFLADWHIGGEYGCPSALLEMTQAFDSIISRAKPAEKAVIVGLGDLLDANDHKGVTPASGNPTDTRRDNHLGNTRAAIAVMKHVVHRALETHDEVELHIIRGNHDETAHHAVLLALDEHLADNPRCTVIVPQTEEEEEFRVISWGECACFPHHGDKAKPMGLKDVWTDQFPDEWAAAKVWRLIATGHLHTDKVTELNGGAEHRQFGSPHRPNRWARLNGYFNRGRVSILTVHKTLGLTDETHSNLKPMLRGKRQ